MFARLLKYSLTTGSLNPDAQPIDVASGARIDKFCLFFNPSHHCVPAFFHLIQDSGTTTLLFTAYSNANSLHFFKDKPKYIPAK